MATVRKFPTQAERPSATVASSQQIGDIMHTTLPGWFAKFQSTYGLSFLVICSAYLMGKLATLGWVKDLLDPLGWGWFDGAGVVFFFLGGVVISGIALSCSMVFVRCLTAHPFWRVGNLFMMLFTLAGMIVFFGIEVWASLEERSNNVVMMVADRWLLHALQVPTDFPLSPTALVVSLMFPLGTLFFGFVQQGKVRKTREDLDDAKLSQEERLQQAKFEAELEGLKGERRAAQARGWVGAGRAAVETARGPQIPDHIEQEDPRDFQ